MCICGELCVLVAFPLEIITYKDLRGERDEIKRWRIGLNIYNLPNDNDEIVCAFEFEYTKPNDIFENSFHVKINKSMEMYKLMIEMPMNWP